MLSQLDMKSPNVQAIILSPTRELASQTNRIVGEIWCLVCIAVQ